MAPDSSPLGIARQKAQEASEPLTVVFGKADNIDSSEKSLSFKVSPQFKSYKMSVYFMGSHRHTMCSLVDPKDGKRRIVSDVLVLDEKDFTAGTFNLHIDNTAVKATSFFSVLVILQDFGVLVADINRLSFLSAIDYPFHLVTPTAVLIGDIFETPAYGVITLKQVSSGTSVPVPTNGFGIFSCPAGDWIIHIAPAPAGQFTWFGILAFGFTSQAELEALSAVPATAVGARTATATARASAAVPAAAPSAVVAPTPST